MEAGQASWGESEAPKNVLSDRYVPGSPLGRGAFATTYLGEDRFLHRPVVIKLLNADQSEAADLFRREVRVTSSLTHPNIVRILASGVMNDGRPYYVTEWVNGRDLGAVLAETGALGRGRSFAVAGGIADALAYIHGRGLVHRDLKPSNILIPGWPSAPEFGHPKILDFGVAGLLSGGQTRAGMVFGTPRYMSPEQVLGEPQSPATDVYGWGLLFFEMLAGRALRGATERPEVLFRSILEKEPQLQEFASIPAECADLILRCVRRNPRERPTIQAVIRELNVFAGVPLHQAPVAPGPDWMQPTPVFAPDASPIPAPTAWQKDKTLMQYSRLAARSRLRWIWPALAAVACVAFILRLVPGRGLALSAGLLLIAASIAAGFRLRKWLGRKSTAKAEAFDLALGAKSRVDVTATLALQLDDLVCRLRRLDERILAGSVALMLDEYGRASDAKDRQSALMNVVALSEKLSQRLSPWYVRYKDVIASAVAVIGALSGLLTTMNALRGPHK